MEASVQSMEKALEKSEEQLDNITWRLNSIEMTMACSPKDFSLSDLISTFKSKKCEYEQIQQEIIDLHKQEAILHSEFKNTASRIKKKLVLLNNKLGARNT